MKDKATLDVGSVTNLTSKPKKDAGNYWNLRCNHKTVQLMDKTYQNYQKVIQLGGVLL